MKAGNDFEIMPYVGIGKIRFGMTKEEVRATLGVPFESFLKSESSELPTDAFDSLSIHVYYKLPGVCEAIEFGDFGENPTFKGYKFMGKPYKMVEDWLKNLDPDCYKDNTGLTTM